jgi:LPS sulfotransferase NodH
MEPLVAALAGDARVRYIHISRANHLRVLLSLELARRTATWAAKNGGHPADARIAIAPEALVAFSAQRRADEAMLRERFAGAPFHEVEYESLTRDLPGVLRALQRFIGVEPVPIEPLLQKQTTGSLADRILNHDALRAHFAGTEYAGWFDD